MKLISIFAALITLTSNITAQTTSALKNSPWTGAGGGNILFLDRQAPSCAVSNQGSAMSYFYLERSANGGDSLRYEFSCIQSGSIGTVASTKSTASNATNGGSDNKSVNFLDRHHVNCPSGKVLRNFGLKRVGNSNIKYEYSCVAATTLCCKTINTTKNEMGNKSSFYLDRQHVGTLSSKKFAIKGFQLKSVYSPKEQIWYTYEICQIEDNQARQELTAITASLVNAKEELQIAEHDLEQSKSKKNALESKVSETRTRLQNTRNSDGLKTDC